MATGNASRIWRKTFRQAINSPVAILAMAVQLISYEIRMEYLAINEKKSSVDNEDRVQYPPFEDIERFYNHLEAVLMYLDLSESVTLGKS